MIRSTRNLITAFILSITLILGELPAAPPDAYAQGSNPDSSETLRVYLPVISSPIGPPQFTILSPADGLKVSGTSIFAVQPIQPQTIAKVTFRAGSVTLGTDTTPADGYRLFLDASLLPAGPLELTATATGPAGDVSSKSVHVTIVPNPLASAVVDAKGNTLGTANGSTIVVPPGAVSTTTTVAVQDKTQAQVTADNGIDWEGLGVTFLGAIDVQTSGPISKPLGVSSVGFGNRIQPGQAIVTYRIFPDADGDGADELVVVNGANLAPNGAIVSSPVAEIALTNVATHDNTGTVRDSAVGLSGPPGTMLTFDGNGFNPLSIQGNRARFRSLVNGQVFDLPGIVDPHAGDGSTQRLITLIPLLVPGPATVELFNQSTGSTIGPFDLMVEPAPELSKPAAMIIDEILVRVIDNLEQLRSLTNQDFSFGDINQAISVTEQLRSQFQALNADPEAQVLLTALATLFQNSGTLALLSHTLIPKARIVSSCDVNALKDIATGLGMAGAAMGATAAFFLATGPIGWGLGAMILGGAALGAIGGGMFLGAGIEACVNGPPPQQCTPTSTSAPKSGYITSLTIRRTTASRQTRPTMEMDGAPPPATMGVGGAPPPGGNGCGNIMGFEEEGLVQSAARSELQAGRFMVRIFPRSGTGRALTPFTGASDPGGYFFIPLIPVTEPFKAVALDNLTGATTVVTGTGPALGDSVYMSFDFSGVQGNHFAINIGDTVTAGAPKAGAGELPPGGADLYTFSAVAGQQVFFDLFDVQGQLFTAHWKLTSPSGSVLFDQNLGCCGGVDVGVRTLPEAGLYTLRVGDNTEPITATYGFKLWNVPPPDRFAITVGDTIANGIPRPGAGNIESPGVRDIYTFTAAAGQQLYFDVLNVPIELAQVNWQLTAPNGDILFDKILNCCNVGEPGYFELAQGGVYTITVGDDLEIGTGGYSFKVWQVPPPNQFTIAVGNTVSDGVPGPGAGRIESPAAHDIYNFTASAGQQVQLHLLSSDSALGNITWQMKDSNGAQLFSTCFSCAQPGPLTLTTGGIYTITVGSNGTDGTGSYSFQLQAP